MVSLLLPTLPLHGRQAWAPHPDSAFRHHRDAPRDCPLRAQAGYDVVKRYYELHHQALVQLHPSASAVFLTNAKDTSPDVPVQRPWVEPQASSMPQQSTRTPPVRLPLQSTGPDPGIGTGLPVVGCLSVGCVAVGLVSAMVLVFAVASGGAPPSTVQGSLPAAPRPVPVVPARSAAGTGAAPLLSDLLGAPVDWGTPLAATPRTLEPVSNPGTGCSAAFTDRRETTADGLLAGEHAQLMSYRDEGLFLVSIDLARDQPLRSYLVQRHGPPRVSRGMELWDVGSTAIQLRFRNGVHELRIYERNRRRRYHDEVERRCRR
jgi:hypothetical protein